MNKYELAIILKGTLEDEVIKAEMEKIQGIITRFDGVIDKVDDWGKRRLAYEIQKTNEGYYSFISFTSEASAPKEIENRVRILENVLRYMLLRQDA